MALIDVRRAVRPCGICGELVEHIGASGLVGSIAEETIWIVEEEHWAPCGALCCAPIRRPEPHAEAERGASFRHGWRGDCIRCGPLTQGVA